MLRTLVGTALTITLMVVACPATADVGPPDRSCTVDKRCAGKGAECRYVNSQPDAGDLQCAADAEQRGLERVCSRGGGTVGMDVYCPKGTGTKASGCAAAPGDAGMVGGVAAFALVMVAAKTRRRSRHNRELRR